MNIDFSIYGLFYVYFLLLRPIFSKSIRNKLGKRLLYLGHGSNNIVVTSIIALLMLLIRLIQVFILNNTIFNFRHIFMIVFPLIIIGWLFYASVQKTYIYEEGISSFTSSWRWNDVKLVQWYYGINNDRIKGLKIYVDKNIFTSLTGFKIYEINKNQVDLIKKYIEKNYSDKISNQNAA
jgi:hypothetical protein